MQPRIVHGYIIMKAARVLYQVRGLKELFCEFWDLSVFVSHLDGTLTSSVGPECVELISIVQRAISGVSLICL